MSDLRRVAEAIEAVFGLDNGRVGAPTRQDMYEVAQRLRESREAPAHESEDWSCDSCGEAILRGDTLTCVACVNKESREAPAPPEKDVQQDSVAKRTIRAWLDLPCPEPHLPAGHYALAPDDPYFAMVDVLLRVVERPRRASMSVGAGSFGAQMAARVHAADPRTRAGREPKEKPETEAGAVIAAITAIDLRVNAELKAENATLRKERDEAIDHLGEVVSLIDDVLAAHPETKKARAFLAEKP